MWCLLWDWVALGVIKEGFTPDVPGFREDEQTPGVVVKTCNLSTLGAKAERLGIRLAWATRVSLKPACVTEQDPVS